MNNLKKTLESGAVLEVTMSPFVLGTRLLKTVTKEIETLGISLGKGNSFNEILQQEVSDDIINTVKAVVCRILSSDAIETVLWECMQRATYNGVKISQDTFEDEKARGDYLIVAKEVLWFNLIPFVKNLGSLFQEIKTNHINIQKSQ